VQEEKKRGILDVDKKRVKARVPGAAAHREKERVKGKGSI